MEVNSLRRRHGVGLVVTSAFMTVFVFATMHVIGGGIQNYQVSRGGVPPYQSWIFAIASGDADMTSVNRQIASVLSRSGATVICAEEFGMSKGAPVLAVYDNRPNPESLISVDGQWFTTQEMTSPQPTLILRSGSYLSLDPSLGGSSAILPTGPVVGTFAAATAVRYEAITTMMSYFPSVLPYVIYLMTDDVSVAEGLVSILTEHGDITVTGPETVVEYLASYNYSVPCAIACLAGLLILAVATVDGVRSDRPRWMIERLVGSSANSAALRSAGRQCLSSLPAAALAEVVMCIALAESAALLPPSWSLLTVSVSVTIPCAVTWVVAFVATRVRRLHYRDWLK